MGAANRAGRDSARQHKIAAQRAAARRAQVRRRMLLAGGSIVAVVVTLVLAQGADASANYLTAGICQLTGNQPATACSSAVQALEPQL